MNCGKAVRLVRSARGWSQKALAERLELDPSYVSLLESGQRAPSAATMESLSKGLGIPLHLFMLLAADKKELRGVSQNQAAELGAQLLKLLSAADSELSPAR